MVQTFFLLPSMVSLLLVPFNLVKIIVVFNLVELSSLGEILISVLLYKVFIFIISLPLHHSFPPSNSFR